MKINKKKLKNFINEYSGSNEIVYETELFDSGYIDSIGLLSIINYLEEEYDIQIETQNINSSNFGTINQIEKFLISING